MLKNEYLPFMKPVCSSDIIFSHFLTLSLLVGLNFLRILQSVFENMALVFIYFI